MRCTSQWFRTGEENTKDMGPSWFWCERGGSFHVHDHYRQLEDPWQYWAAPVTGRQAGPRKRCCEGTAGRGRSYRAGSPPSCIQPRSCLTARWRSHLCAAGSQKPGDQGAGDQSQPAGQRWNHRQLMLKCTEQDFQRATEHHQNTKHTLIRFIM